MNATILKAICKSCPLPELPELLRRVRISDTVVLSVITTHDGTSANVAKIRGHPLLDFVFSTVCQWRYKPQVVGGEPIEFRAVISYEVFSHAPLQIR
jgi:outer membrane biosynthesis protein TonB